MPPDTLVSILINSYNYGRFLRTCIDSTLAQTYRPVEVVVVDDGSTDDSVEIIRSYGSAITALCKANGGQASAFNAGFAAARGEILCLLDADDFFLPEKVECIVELISRHDAAEWCFHELQLVDASGGSVGATVPDQGTTLHDHRATLSRGRLKYSPSATSALSFRRDLLARILPMPESHGVTVSDNYIKAAALSLSPGVSTGRLLACRRIHGGNLYTSRGRRAEGEVDVYTAFWLRKRFPHLDRFSRKVMAVGLGLLEATGGVEPGVRRLADEFLAALPAWQRFELALRARYHRILARRGGS